MKYRPLSLLALAVAAAALVGPVAAGVHDDPGPHQVGWRDEVQPFVGAVTITNRIHYPALSAGQDAPADPASGPYPLVALIHGATADPTYYDALLTHVASHGYVVASIGGIAGPLESYQNMANATTALIDWVVAASADPLSLYFGLVSDDGYTLIGSSRGGGVAGLVIGTVPKVRAVYEMEPSYYGTGTALANLAAWDGSWLFCAGELDTTNPPAEVKQILTAATGSPRKLYVEVQGAGHAGALDSDLPGLPVDPLPHDEQLQLHLRFATAFLAAEIRGDEDAYDVIVGAGASADPLEHESYCADPPFWAIETGPAPGTVALGIAGAEHDFAAVAVAAGPASIPTIYGLLAIDPANAIVLGSATLGAEGTFEVSASVPPGASGTVLYAQGIALSSGGAFSRADVVLLP